MFVNDVMAEKLVKKATTSKDRVCKCLIILFAVLLILLVLIFPLFFGIGYLFLLSGAIGFGIGFGCYYYVTGMYVEYEYCIVNENFSIDVIKARTRRSPLYSGSVKDFEMVAKLKDANHPISEFQKKDTLAVNCVSGENPDDEWYIATKMGKNNLLITFEPDEKFLKAMYRYNPRNVMYRPSAVKKSGKKE
ncbi:MAG: hypothetical protein J6Y08_09490 [Clostridiales bacterium]|nr:hypothetical protein [Clostridiales bacterium]